MISLSLNLAWATLSQLTQPESNQNKTKNESQSQLSSEDPAVRGLKIQCLFLPSKIYRDPEQTIHGVTNTFTVNWTHPEEIVSKLGENNSSG